MNHRILAGILAMSGVAGASASDLDWYITYGIHDFQVESSDTFGGNVAVSFDYLSDSGIIARGNADIYVDIDKDKLDPDHIPVWFKSAYYIRGNLLKPTENWALDWQVDLRGKRNTVSSVEKQIKFYPSLNLAYSRPAFGGNLQAGVGYFFLEIDDDVPKSRGFVRGQFGNDATAWTTDVSGYLMLAPGWKLDAGYEYWADGSETLETKYRASLSVDTSHWVEHSLVVLSMEHSQYNLDHYNILPKDDPDYLAILPWDRDTLFRLSMTLPW